jgi:hypothetical protein
MKKIILTILGSFPSLSAFAEKFVMVTHGEGKKPFLGCCAKRG